MNIFDLYRFFHRLFRGKRMRHFENRFRLSSNTRVLDVGGSLFNWSFVRQFPRLVILNLSVPRECRENGNTTWLVADGRYLPFADSTFDIVYSNSVIEHLGDFASQRAFAREIARVGVRYYVQTPNKRFPVEPHLITPLIHYLPKTVQKRLLRNFTIWGLLTRPTVQQCDNFLREVRLLDERELRQLFPDAEIWHERVLGLTKSLIAVKL